VMSSQTLFAQNYVSMIQGEKIRIDHVTAAIEVELVSLGGDSVIEGERYGPSHAREKNTW